jgi:hypothetical protein
MRRRRMEGEEEKRKNNEEKEEGGGLLTMEHIYRVLSINTQLRGAEPEVWMQSSTS